MGRSRAKESSLDDSDSRNLTLWKPEDSTKSVTQNWAEMRYSSQDDPAEDQSLFVHRGAVSVAPVRFDE